MTGRKNLALQVPLVVPYKALEKLPKALYGTTASTCSARFLSHKINLTKTTMFRARAVRYACLLCHLVKHHRCDDNNLRG